MTDEAANQHPPPRWWLRLLALVVVAVAGFLAITSVRVVRTASLEEIHPADAIVVFGAAEYSGRPSPVLRARLDQASPQAAPLPIRLSAKAELGAII
jgi:hypothetical protein